MYSWIDLHRHFHTNGIECTVCVVNNIVFSIFIFAELDQYSNRTRTLFADISRETVLWRLWTLRQHRDGGKVGKKQCPSGSCVCGGLLFFLPYFHGVCQYLYVSNAAVSLGLHDCISLCSVFTLFLSSGRVHALLIVPTRGENPVSCHVRLPPGLMAEEVARWSLNIKANVSYSTLTRSRWEISCFFSLPPLLPLLSLSLFFLFSLPKIVSKTLIRATKVQEIQQSSPFTHHQIICSCKS